MPYDYIVQVIEQFAQLIARLGGLRDEKRYDEAEEAIGDALNGAFGPLLETLDALAPQRVPALIDNPEKLALYCSLLRETAHIASDRGDASRAQRLVLRAMAIERAAATAAEHEPTSGPGSRV